jgi:hypothetical protein
MKTSSTWEKDALTPLLVLLEARFKLAGAFSQPGAVPRALVAPAKSVLAARLERLVFLAENDQPYDNQDRQVVDTLDIPLIVAMTGTSSVFNKIARTDVSKD